MGAIFTITRQTLNLIGLLNKFILNEKYKREFTICVYQLKQSNYNTYEHLDQAWKYKLEMIVLDDNIKTIKINLSH